MTGQTSRLSAIHRQQVNLTELVITSFRDKRDRSAVRGPAGGRLAIAARRQLYRFAAFDVDPPDVIDAAVCFPVCLAPGVQDCASVRRQVRIADSRNVYQIDDAERARRLGADRNRAHHDDDGEQHDADAVWHRTLLECKRCIIASRQ